MTTLCSRPIAAPVPKWDHDRIYDLIMSVVHASAPYSTKAEVTVAATILARTLLRTDVIADFWINDYNTGVQIGYQITPTDPFNLVSLPC